jgi:hypothetical protein
MAAVCPATPAANARRASERVRGVPRADQPAARPGGRRCAASQLTEPRADRAATATAGRPARRSAAEWAPPAFARPRGPGAGLARALALLDDPVTLADLPSRVLPVPDSDHGRSATVVVILRGSQRCACPAAGVTASPARGRAGIRLAVPAGRPPGGRGEGARHRPPRPARRDRSRRNRRGCPSSRACSPGSDANLGPARSRPWHDQNPATRLRETPGHIGLGNRGSSRGCGGCGQIRQLSG